jgi:hypothetical protein
VSFLFFLPFLGGFVLVVLLDDKLNSANAAKTGCFTTRSRAKGARSRLRSFEFGGQEGYGFRWFFKWHDAGLL